MDPMENLKKDFKVILEQLKISLKINEAEKQLALNAGQQAEWAKREGEELHNQIVADAEYRQWRAKVVNTLLAQDPKLSEWKVKAIIEQDDKFVEHKQMIAKSQMESQVYGRFVNALHDQGEAIKFFLSQAPKIDIKK